MEIGDDQISEAKKEKDENCIKLVLYIHYCFKIKNRRSHGGTANRLAALKLQDFVFKVTVFGEFFSSGSCGILVRN